MLILVEVTGCKSFLLLGRLKSCNDSRNKRNYMEAFNVIALFISSALLQIDAGLNLEFALVSSVQCKEQPVRKQEASPASLCCRSSCSCFLVSRFVVRSSPLEARKRPLQPEFKEALFKSAVLDKVSLAKNNRCPPGDEKLGGGDYLFNGGGAYLLPFPPRSLLNSRGDSRKNFFGGRPSISLLPNPHFSRRADTLMISFFLDIFLR